MKLYAIKDNKVGIYHHPRVYVNQMEATRMLHTAVNDPQIQLSMYPEDFDLYEIGEMDEKTGKIDQKDDQPKHVVSAVSLKKLEAKNG